MSVTFPTGFRATGMTAGLKPSGRPDLGLLVSDRRANAVGLFTTNAYPAAPVTLSRERIRKGHAQAVLVNSGDANASRGEAGDRDAEDTTDAIAKALKVDVGDVLACSTGVIGGSFGADAIIGASATLVDQLSADGGAAFAEAICTTDTHIKEARAEVAGIRVGACTKGAAMVEPRLDLATMLTFFTTDAPLAVGALRELADDVVRPVFHQLSIDGCTSTNDTILMLANGAAGGEEITIGSAAFDEMAEALTGMSTSLIEQMAADAEGGTKLLLVEVSGAPSDTDAQLMAKAVVNSVLVKTALFGGDPNPGRLVQAIGASGAAFAPASTTIRLGDIVVADGSFVPAQYDDEGAAHQVMSKDEVTVTIDAGEGAGSARAVGCDLSYDYVKINAEYTT